MLSDFISFLWNIRAWHNPHSLQKSIKVVSRVIAQSPHCQIPAAHSALPGLLLAITCVVFLLTEEKRKQDCSGIQLQAVKLKLAVKSQLSLPTKGHLHYRCFALRHVPQSVRVQMWDTLCGQVLKLWMDEWNLSGDSKAPKDQILKI